MIRLTKNDEFSFVPEQDFELELVSDESIEYKYDEDRKILEKHDKIIVPAGTEIVLFSENEAMLKSEPKGTSLTRRGERIISSEDEFYSMKDKPKRVFWNDELRGGSFTLSDNPEADDGGIWFNGYKRDNVDYVKPEWFGAVGDGVTDDTDALQNSINTGLKIICRNNSVFLITQTLIFKENTVIDLNNSTLKGSIAVLASVNGSFSLHNGELITNATTYVDTYSGVITSLNKSIDSMVLDKIKISAPDVEINGCSIIASNDNSQVKNVYLDVEFIDVGRMGIEFLGHGITDADRLVNYIDNIYVKKIVTKNTGLKSIYGMGISFSGEVRNAHVEYANISNYKDIGFEIATGGKHDGGGKFFINNLVLNNVVDDAYGVQCSVTDGDIGAKSIKFNNIVSNGMCRFRFDVYGKCDINNIVADSVHTITGENTTIHNINIDDIQYSIQPRSVDGALLKILNGNIKSSRSGNSIFIASSNNLILNNLELNTLSGYIVKTYGTAKAKLTNCFINGGTNYATDTSSITYVESSITTGSVVDSGTVPLIMRNVYVNDTLTNS